MKTHYLKTIQPYFDLVENGQKKYELRNNDRDFQAGDEVYLQEYDKIKEVFSGHEIRATITHVLSDFTGLNNGYCIFSFVVTQHIFKTK